MEIENVCIINDFGFVDGGASNVAISSALGLAREGLKVFFFYAVGPLDTRLGAEPGLVSIGLEQKDILNNPDRLHATFQGLWNFKAGREIERLLRGLNPEKTIVHVHTWTKALSSSVVKKSTDLGFKVVITLHDYFSICPNGGFYLYSSHQYCKFRPLSSACILTNCDSRSYSHKLWRVARSITQKRFGSIPSGIKFAITISKFSRQILAPHFPNCVKFYHVENPIDLPKLDRPVNVALNQTYFAVGRISPEKGMDLLASAAKQLQVPVQILGDGAARNELMAINPDVEISGWVSKLELCQRLMSARALVFPTRLYETAGLVVSEAASMGIPAIVPATSAARDLVADGETGLWFRSGDANDLKAKMRLLQDDTFVNNLGLKAYHHYWSSPKDLEHYIQSLLNVYHDIMNEAV